MSWLRAGDTAATYPPLMLTATDPSADDRTVNEVSGWLHRMMEQAAGHRTDYLIDMGTAALMGGSRLAELIRMCKRVKLIKVVRRAGLEYIEIIDDPAFLHVRLKAEQDWENQRKRDNANPALTSHVRLRDGDGCRWCGIVTQWGTPDQKSARVGTYDHLVPGERATVETMVIACRGCNSARQNDIDSWTTELKPVPERPYYSATTAAFIEKHRGVTVVATDRQRPSGPAVDAPPRQRRPRSSGLDAPSRERPATPDVDAPSQRPADQAVDAPSAPAPSGSALHAGQAPAVGTDDLSASVQTVMDILGGETDDFVGCGRCGYDQADCSCCGHGFIGCDCRSVEDRPISADPSPPVSGNVGSGRGGSGSAFGHTPGRERATRKTRRSRGRPR